MCTFTMIAIPGQRSIAYTVRKNQISNTWAKLQYRPTNEVSIEEGFYWPEQAIWYMNWITVRVGRPVIESFSR